MGLLKPCQLITFAPLRTSYLVLSGPLNIDPSIKRLAAHLLQQLVDERAPERVEKSASKHSIGIYRRLNARFSCAFKHVVVARIGGYPPPELK